MVVCHHCLWLAGARRQYYPFTSALVSRAAPTTSPLLLPPLSEIIFNFKESKRCTLKQIRLFCSGARSAVCDRDTPFPHAHAWFFAWFIISLLQDATVFQIWVWLGVSWTRRREERVREFCSESAIGLRRASWLPSTSTFPTLFVFTFSNPNSVFNIQRFQSKFCDHWPKSRFG